MSYDFSREQWPAIKGAMVDHCVNQPTDSAGSIIERECYSGRLFEQMKTMTPGDCVETLTPILADWLNNTILPTLLTRIAGKAESAKRHQLEVGLALLSYSPARRSTPASNPNDADQMTKALCRSLKNFRLCFMKMDPACARAILGQCLKNHFSEARDGLLLQKLTGLKIRIWVKIEKVYYEIMDELDKEAQANGMNAQIAALQRLPASQELCERILERLPKKLGIKRWHRVRDYIDLYLESEKGLPLRPDEPGEAVEMDQQDDCAKLLTDDLTAALLKGAIDKGEYLALILEYVDGYPAGEKAKTVKDKLDMSEQTYDELVGSALVKLGRWIDNNAGASR